MSTMLFDKPTSMSAQKHADPKTGADLSYLNVYGPGTYAQWSMPYHAACAVAAAFTEAMTAPDETAASMASLAPLMAKLAGVK